MVKDQDFSCLSIPEMIELLQALSENRQGTNTIKDVSLCQGCVLNKIKKLTQSKRVKPKKKELINVAA